MRDRHPALTRGDLAALAWVKMDGLLPAVVQDARTAAVLMLGYMNEQALSATLETGQVTFFSRSRQKLWMKGETSGNGLKLMSVHADCDGDALLILAEPAGPTCHLGQTSCFGKPGLVGPAWLAALSSIIAERARSGDETSYTRKLLAQGLPRIAQKMGEEGVEVALAAVTGDAISCAEESADLLYHLAVLMEVRQFGWEDIVAILQERHRQATKSDEPVNLQE